MKSIEQVIGDWTESAVTAARLGHEHDAKLIRAVLHDVQESSRTYLLWLNETEAQRWSGKSRRWLRAEFEQLQAIGFAELRDGRRMFRACALPRRADLDALREAGRLAGMDTATESAA